MGPINLQAASRECRKAKFAGRCVVSKCSHGKSAGHFCCDPLVDLPNPSASPDGADNPEGTEEPGISYPPEDEEECPCVCRPGREAINQAIKECDAEVSSKRCSVTTCKKNERIDGVSCCRPQ